MDDSKLFIPGYKPKKSIRDYLRSQVNRGIYDQLSADDEWEGLFEPFEFLNLLYEQIGIMDANRLLPRLVRRHLLELDLSEIQLYYLLDKMLLVEVLKSPLQMTSILYTNPVRELHSELESRLFPDKILEHDEEYEYEFERVEEHLALLNSYAEKKAYLIKQKIEYQKKPEVYNFANESPHEPSYLEKVNLELVKLEELHALEVEKCDQRQQDGGVKPRFNISSKKGAKTDLIRVLNALWELRLIVNVDGEIPPKKMFMVEMGNFLGEDLTNYHTNLSQAFKNQTLEVNLKVFDEMKQKIINSHYTKDDKY